MVFTYLYGRIGNNLFQIVQAITLAERVNKSFAGAFPLDYWCHEPDNCPLRVYLNQFKGNVLRNVPILDSLPPGLYEIRTRDQYLAYDGKNDAILNLNTFLYYDHYFFDTELIKSFFKIDKNSLEYIKNKYPQIFSSKKTTSITVRRGDYLKIPDEFAICTWSYYRKALSEINNIGFCLIITDDEDWCKRHFNENGYLIVGNEPPAIDLYLQTLCSNNIISNSSFAWWGAYLNPNKDKTIIAPWPWLGISHRGEIKRSDINPSDWILVRNRSVYWKFKGFSLYLFKRWVSINKKLKDLINESL